MADKYQSTDSGSMRVVKGKTIGYDMPMAVKSETIKPRFTMTEKDIPEAEDWEVGKKYTIELQVKLVSMNEYEGQPCNYSFEITKVGTEK